MRISGSRHLARRGLEVKLIQILARWESDTVLHYIKEVPLEVLAQKYLDGGNKSEREVVVAKGHVSSLDLAASGANKQLMDKQRDLLVGAFNEETQRVKALASQFEAELSSVIAFHKPQYIINDGGKGFIHAAGNDFATIHVAEWRTKCSSKYCHC